MSGVKEDQQSEWEQLSQLRERVHLSSNKLLELTYNDNKFMEKLVSYNIEARRLINEDLTQEALVYLAQAERILEYGASCGKSIDRNIIVTTLHNEACCYYKEGDLAASAKYLEGLIFNLQSHRDSTHPSPSSAHLDSCLSLSVEKKMELVQYYLKFCTINSQAKRREAALSAGKQVTHLCASLLADLQLDDRLTSDSGKEAEGRELRAVVGSVRVFREEVRVGEVGSYVAITRHWIRKWSSAKVVKKISFCLEKHVSNYSISEVIDMVPIQYQPEEEKDCESSLSPRDVLRQLLHFSMGYFTISTEYRLVAEQLYGEGRGESEEYKRANIYHLLSILFLACNLNCDLLFIKQVISSYEHHFKTDLSAPHDHPEAERLSDSLLFDARRPKDSKLNTTASQAKKKRLASEYEDSYACEKKATVKTSNMQERLKRSLSKKNALSSNNKLNSKVINQSLMESKPHNNKSITGSKPRTRSISKDSTANCNKGTEGRKQEKGGRYKKTNDEYQLGRTKIVKKRINSGSSAELSLCHRSKSKGRAEIEVKQKKKNISRNKEAGKKKEKIKTKERSTSNRHYYL